MAVKHARIQRKRAHVVPRIPPRLTGKHPTFTLARVHLEDEAPLLKVVRTGGAPRRLTRPRQGREQNRREDADDRNDHQQLDKGKTYACCSCFDKHLTSPFRTITCDVQSGSCVSSTQTAPLGAAALPNLPHRPMTSSDRIVKHSFFALNTIPVAAGTSEAASPRLIVSYAPLRPMD